MSSSRDGERCRSRFDSNQRCATNNQPVRRPNEDRRPNSPLQRRGNDHVSNSTWKHGTLALDASCALDLILKEASRAREAYPRRPRSSPASTDSEPVGPSRRSHERSAQPFAPQAHRGFANAFAPWREWLPQFKNAHFLPGTVFSLNFVSEDLPNSRTST